MLFFQEIISGKPKCFYCQHGMAILRSCHVLHQIVLTFFPHMAIDVLPESFYPLRFFKNSVYVINEWPMDAPIIDRFVTGMFNLSCKSAGQLFCRSNANQWLFKIVSRSLIFLTTQGFAYPISTLHPPFIFIAKFGQYGMSHSSPFHKSKNNRLLLLRRMVYLDIILIFKCLSARSKYFQ